MSDFPTHTKQTAPETAKPILDAVEKAYGMTPNLHRKMAESPALLEGYWQLSQVFSSSSLTPIEQQVVLIAASVINNCTYCVAAHSVLADMVDTPAEVTEALRTGDVIPDTRLQALRKFSQSVVITRGWVHESEVDVLLAEGFTREQVLDVILGVGLKTLSNYTNHLVTTELDTAFQGRSWKPTP
jgi:uncharacterized peroxidase-related enzyme